MSVLSELRVSRVIILVAWMLCTLIWALLPRVSDFIAMTPAAPAQLEAVPVRAYASPADFAHMVVLGVLMHGMFACVLLIINRDIRRHQ